MNANTTREMSDESTLWLQNMVNGLSGMVFKVKHSVYCDSSPFQKVEVFDSYAFGRILVLAGNVVLTERDEYIYSEMITHPAMQMHRDPRSICIIGGGDGGVLREVLKYDQVENVTVVEIDELVTQTVKANFEGLRVGFADSRALTVFEDGSRFLERCNDTFDVIFVDSYDPGGPVQSITSEPFYHLVCERLAPDGVAVFQTDSPTLRSEHVRHAMRNVAPIYAEQKPYICSIPSFPEGLCSFVVASKSPETLERFDEERYGTIAGSCNYYNREIHSGAFLLPRSVRNALLG